MKKNHSQISTAIVFNVSDKFTQKYLSSYLLSENVISREFIMTKESGCICSEQIVL